MSARQGLGSVLSAEMKRTVMRPKALVSALIFIAVAILLQMGAMALTQWALQQSPDPTVAELAPTLDFSLPTSLLCFCFGIYAAAFTARDYNDGSIMATLLCVPKRSTLFLARILPWVCLSFVFSLVAMAVVFALQLSIVGDIAAGICQMVLSAVVVMSTTILGFCCGSITKKGSFSVFLFLALWTLLPMVLNLAGAFLPPALQDIVTYVGYVIPGGNFEAAPRLFSPATVDSWPLVLSTISTIAWTVGLPIVSYILFAKRATLTL